MRVMLIVLFLSLWPRPAGSDESRPWILIVCGPKGQFCIPYTYDMVPYRYVTKTGCEVDMAYLPIPTGYHVKCDKEVVVH